MVSKEPSRGLGRVNRSAGETRRSPRTPTPASDRRDGTRIRAAIRLVRMAAPVLVARTRARAHRGRRPRAPLSSVRAAACAAAAWCRRSRGRGARAAEGRTHAPAAPTPEVLRSRARSKRGGRRRFPCAGRTQHAAPVRRELAGLRCPAGSYGEHRLPSAPRHHPHRMNAPTPAGRVADAARTDALISHPAPDLPSNPGEPTMSGACRRRCQFGPLPYMWPRTRRIVCRWLPSRSMTASVRIPSGPPPLGRPKMNAIPLPSGDQVGPSLMRFGRCVSRRSCFASGEIR